MVRIDLHTHSEASIDGGLSPEDYAKLLSDELLDVIAITDHNRIDFAKGMQKALGAERIIVGEEIMTQDGEIIGLYLSSVINPGMTIEATIDAIRSQNGLVYIPHPFEKIRKGIKPEILHRIIDRVDIIETNNGRALTKKHSIEAQTWAVKNKIVGCASSDAHGLAGARHTYTNIGTRPTRDTILVALSEATFVYKRPPLKSFLYPKINKFKKALKGVS